MSSTDERNQHVRQLLDALYEKAKNADAEVDESETVSSFV